LSLCRRKFHLYLLSIIEKLASYLSLFFRNAEGEKLSASVDFLGQ